MKTNTQLDRARRSFCSSSRRLNDESFGFCTDQGDAATARRGPNALTAIIVDASFAARHLMLPRRRCTPALLMSYPPPPLVSLQLRQTLLYWPQLKVFRVAEDLIFNKRFHSTCSTEPVSAQSLSFLFLWAQSNQALRLHRGLVAGSSFDAPKSKQVRVMESGRCWRASWCFLVRVQPVKSRCAL